MWLIASFGMSWTGLASAMPERMELVVIPPRLITASVPTPAAEVQQPAVSSGEDEQAQPAAPQRASAPSTPPQNPAPAEAVQEPAVPAAPVEKPAPPPIPTPASLPTPDVVEAPEQETSQNAAPIGPAGNSRGEEEPSGADFEALPRTDGVAFVPGTTGTPAAAQGGARAATARGDAGSGADAAITRDGGSRPGSEAGEGAGGATAGGDAGIERAAMRAPRSYRCAPPRYPLAARRRGEEGRVVLRLLVTREGRVGEVRILRSSGVETLDRAAEEAAREWRFEPARRGSEAIAAWVEVTVRFRLEGAPEIR